MEAAGHAADALVRVNQHRLRCLEAFPRSKLPLKILRIDTGHHTDVVKLVIIGKYWAVLLVMGVVGLVITYLYVYFVCRKLFPNYVEQQFLGMYGMLTGTASTGIILLREIDGDFKTPVADNLVYQNFPAMIFGFPILLLATMAPTQPYLTLGIVVAFMIVINILLFRSFLFKKKAK